MDGVKTTKQSPVIGKDKVVKAAYIRSIEEIK